MGCRIGMTTNSERRKEDWKTVYRNLRDWEILYGPTTKDRAQEIETRLSEEYGCESHPGGDDPNAGLLAQWYVYGFNHDGPK